MVSCLREGNPESILTHGSNLYPEDPALSIVDYMWVPVRDGSMVRIPTDQDKMASERKVPLMAGLVNNEGATLFSFGVCV